MQQCIGTVTSGVHSDVWCSYFYFSARNQNPLWVFLLMMESLLILTKALQQSWTMLLFYQQKTEPRKKPLEDLSEVC